MSTGSYLLRNAAHYAGQIQGCRCDPYIIEEDCDRVLSTKRATPRKSDHTYIFSGMIYCAECGGRMGAHRHFYKRKGTQRSEQVYDNCTRHYSTKPFKCSSKVNIYERDIEADILNRIEDVVEQCTVASEITRSKQSSGDK